MIDPNITDLEATKELLDRLKIPYDMYINDTGWPRERPKKYTVIRVKPHLEPRYICHFNFYMNGKFSDIWYKENK